ncbi:fatty acid hydroxylase superfamily-domain-containing protein [Halteromyces radiatus]|uniref:fatty acid hydroxylase superfamily-domain-containing protein n=1 Tax=Halteromyces radiatus TaxID=101107 RepID=UPI002220AFC6|nr:fatty acid hydroxylase superfamily-domain-containing protein [Halteromyces radiatus]KAI8093389.1 fatty acid hydroxylase superfamily-domain-containing protein [Halteromyces radiatus]
MYMTMIQTVVTTISTAFYSIHNDPWADEILALWVPLAAYWIYSMMYHFLMLAEIPYFEQYRIHSSEDISKRNRVTIKRVLIMVTLQQLIQVILGALILHPIHPQVMIAQQEQTLARLVSYSLKFLNIFCYPWIVSKEQAIQLAFFIANSLYWMVIPSIQFFAAMVILDTHQYFLHRLFHLNKFLYKHFHSHHHRLYVPYAFGALYNHPVEGFLLDSVGAALACELTRMTPRMSMIFFTFSTLKTVDDHCGYYFPWNPLQFLFGNNVKYHDIHHQAYGIKTNFSQPFFTFWDKLLGTEMTNNPRDTKKQSDKAN